MSTNEIVVTFPGGKRVDAHFGEAVVQTDQPPELGGDGSAPAPFDLFLASLATCAGIYALGFCQARGLPTEGLLLVQHQEVDPATKLVRAVRLELTLPRDFPQQYVPAILRAVENCKVKKTIAAAPTFEVALADARGDAEAARLATG
ncbi:MAG TPA: OsmC family protein [Minicystis sp.]|nr:OsmC family protein [Minicystis sp.]